MVRLAPRQQGTGPMFPHQRLSVIATTALYAPVRIGGCSLHISILRNIEMEASPVAIAPQISYNKAIARDS